MAFPKLLTTVALYTPGPDPRQQETPGVEAGGFLLCLVNRREKKVVDNPWTFSELGHLSRGVPRRYQFFFMP